MSRNAQWLMIALLYARLYASYRQTAATFPDSLAARVYEIYASGELCMMYRAIRYAVLYTAIA